MSIYFSSKGSNREYIVVKHALPGLTTEILGIRYMDGFGVVAKDSKEHLRLKQVRMAVTSELPITYLKHVKSVINNSQVKAIWGADVYRYYLEQMKAKESNPISAQTAERPICKHEKDGKRCGNQVIVGFTTCRKHIESDAKVAPRLSEMKLLPKEEKKQFIDSIIDEIRGE